MLFVTLHYTDDKKMKEAIQTVVKPDVTPISVEHNAENHKVKISFQIPQELLDLDEVHSYISELINKADVNEVDETNAHLGYLKSGEPASIISRFSQWKSFLLDAKHRSMEGQKVEIFEGNKVLASGILVQYEVADNDQFQVTKATLLTTFGERTFSSNSMVIRATGEFF
ncbi:hypothetical protein [Bacillus alkalicellulosilyticus]|uniref:hypothetical protein n=1 Tax=Alkalihalobacterium alkalicellulosilyticum TaxID=1912214 RepID=UPI0009977D4F|nr:hypothetical protein [Bacillus alkalicellulosilyticus]